MKIYSAGRRKEYAIISKLKKEGYDIVQRTAGSHSPVDIIAINKNKRVIKLIQSKRVLSNDMKYVDIKLKKKIEEQYIEFNGAYTVSFMVL